MQIYGDNKNYNRNIILNNIMNQAGTRTTRNYSYL